MPIPATRRLQHYFLTRWRCTWHGWFERGTATHEKSASCPACGDAADYVEHCEGQTTRPIPFSTRPRLVADGMQFTAADFRINPARPAGTRPTEAE